MKATITLVVEVFDLPKLKAYATSMREDWGDDSLEDDIYDTVVLNVPPGGPLGVGVEIVSQKVTIAN
jgi:hypothetical protein